jgi:hypothetical protein
MAALRNQAPVTPILKGCSAVHIVAVKKLGCAMSNRDL